MVSSGTTRVTQQPSSPRPVYFRRGLDAFRTSGPRGTLPPLATPRGLRRSLRPLLPCRHSPGERRTGELLTRRPRRRRSNPRLGDRRRHPRPPTTRTTPTTRRTDSAPARRLVPAKPRRTTPRHRLRRTGTGRLTLVVGVLARPCPVSRLVRRLPQPVTEPSLHCLLDLFSDAAANEPLRIPDTSPGCLGADIREPVLLLLGCPGDIEVGSGDRKLIDGQQTEAIRSSASRRHLHRPGRRRGRPGH